MTARLFVTAAPGAVLVAPNADLYSQFLAPVTSTVTNPDLWAEVVSLLAEMGRSAEDAAHPKGTPVQSAEEYRDRALADHWAARARLLALVGPPDPLSLQAGATGTVYPLIRALDEAEAEAIDRRADTLPPAGAPF